MSGLEAWGWDDGWRRACDDVRAATSAPHGAPAQPARVIGQERDRWAVRLAASAAAARITRGAFAGPQPVTGDWVLVEPGPAPTDPLSVLAVLPRRTAITRGASGSGAAGQVLAANVDTVWVVHGLDLPLNARRLERYLAAVWESGAVPEVVLTKADLAAAAAEARAEAESLAMGVAVHVVSTADEASVRALRAGLLPGRTVALLGPSGAGKSTLINALSQQSLAPTGEVRAADRKGRHTTTRRELYHIGDGVLLLDTPGLREFRVWALDEGLSRAFADVDELAASCRFGDCRHESEPGCAVLAAVAAGTLSPARLDSFRKLRAEAEWVERKHDPEARAAAVARHKTALKTLKYHPKYREDG